MFGKKCSNCGEKIERNYEFCPYCGKNLRGKHDEEDYGFIGKDDFFSETDSPFGFGSSMFDSLINRAMKELPAIMKSMEQQMRDSPFEEITENRRIPNNVIPSNMKFRLIINGKEVTPKIQEEARVPKQINRPVETKMSEEEAKRISKLPRKEPKTKMKRLSGRLVYELEVPGVKNKADVLISQLENSIEIKAIAKDKVYSKTLNINLPVLDYSLIKGNLTLELQAK